MNTPKNKRDEKQKKLDELCELASMANEPFATDILGSYTGTGADGDVPEQDVDDL